MTEKPFATEAELVAAFCAQLNHRNSRETWTPYHETAGWDVLLVNDVSGIQVGIEAKLSLNAKALCQALESSRWADSRGPDYRAVLVASMGLQNYLTSLARSLGIVVIAVRAQEGWREGSVTYSFSPSLPDENHLWAGSDWPNWCPAQRCILPEYVPDVVGGKASPLALTQWKIAAIKLMILLEREGAVDRRQMAALKLSASRWTDRFNGFLTPTEQGYVRNGRTPDFRAQHPENWCQIEADFDKWGRELLRTPLLAGSAA